MVSGITTIGDLVREEVPKDKVVQSEIALQVAVQFREKSGITIHNVDPEFTRLSDHEIEDVRNLVRSAAEKMRRLITYKQ